MNDKTYTARQGEIERDWFVVDAAGETLGRLATRVARVLEGKHKPTWSPNLDGGDHVIVLNARKISVSSAKLETKSYVRVGAGAAANEKISLAEEGTEVTGSGEGPAVSCLDDHMRQSGMKRQPAVHFR